jgi:signal transduction histidine kinase
VLDALASWFGAPSAGRRRTLGLALARFVHAHGASGAYLAIEAPRVPGLEVGAGTLRRRPGVERAATLERRPLRDLGDAGQLGWLWVDGSAAAASDTSRLIEIALEAARARADARLAIERLSALDEATRAIAGVLTTERVLQLIVDNARRLVGAQYAALGILDQERLIDPFITSGIGRTVRERIGAPPRGHGLLGLIIEESRAIRVRDIAAHPRSAGFPPNHPRMRSLLGVPIVIRGRVLGNFYLADKVGEGEFTEADERLVELFANHAAIAIENARLHEQEQRLAILEERQRIGRDLHDGIIQSIYAVGLTLDDALEGINETPDDTSAKVERAIESLNLTIRDIRNYIFGLRPEPLDHADLIDALAAMAEEFRLNTMIDIAIDISGAGGLFELAAEQTMQLLHLTREALSNVARHARARRTDITLTATSEGLELAVVDDGVGFDPSARRGPGHMGLSNMRTRAAELGGELDIHSAAGRGTRVVARIPWLQPDDPGPVGH